MTEQEAIKEVKRWTNILMSAGRKCVSETAEAQDMAIKALEEVQQYRAIGTIEECRVAVDKMKPKKTAIEAIKVHICPVCGFGGIYDYCGNCGQRVQMLSD